jgi:hypothetical protein
MIYRYPLSWPPGSEEAFNEVQKAYEEATNATTQK